MKQHLSKDDQPLKENSSATQTRPGEGIPHVGRPLDGSEYLDVVEEQKYADKPPSPEERRRQHEKP